MTTFVGICYLVLGLYYDAQYAIQVFLVSLLVALIPLATSKIWFLAPILILIYQFLWGDSTFAWQCILFAPLHWISLMGLVIGAIKELFD